MEGEAEACSSRRQTMETPLAQRKERRRPQNKSNKEFKKDKGQNSANKVNKQPSHQLVSVEEPEKNEIICSSLPKFQSGTFITSPRPHNTKSAFSVPVFSVRCSGSALPSFANGTFRKTGKQIFEPTASVDDKNNNVTAGQYSKEAKKFELETLKESNICDVLEIDHDKSNQLTSKNLKNESLKSNQLINNANIKKTTNNLSSADPYITDHTLPAIANVELSPVKPVNEHYLLIQAQHTGLNVQNINSQKPLQVNCTSEEDDVKLFSSDSASILSPHTHRTGLQESNPVMQGFVAGRQHNQLLQRRQPELQGEGEGEGEKNKQQAHPFITGLEAGQLFQQPQLLMDIAEEYSTSYLTQVSQSEDREKGTHIIEHFQNQESKEQLWDALLATYCANTKVITKENGMKTDKQKQKDVVCSVLQATKMFAYSLPLLTHVNADHMSDARVIENVKGGDARAAFCDTLLAVLEDLDDTKSVCRSIIQDSLLHSRR